MGRDDFPSFWKLPPDLSLAALRSSSGLIAAKLQRHDTAVIAKRDDLHVGYVAIQSGGRTGFSEGLDFLRSIKIFANTESQRQWRAPEKLSQLVYVVAHQCRFIFVVKNLEFSNDCGVVDE